MTVESVLRPFPARFADVLAQLPELSAPNVLDMGCGSAISAVVLKRRYPGSVLFGLDHNAEILKHMPDAMRPIQADLRALPFKERSFGLIIVRHPDLMRWPDTWRSAIEAVPFFLIDNGILLATCYSLPELEKIRALLPATYSPLAVRRELLSPPVEDGADRYTVAVVFG